MSASKLSSMTPERRTLAIYRSPKNRAVRTRWAIESAERETWDAAIEAAARVIEREDHDDDEPARIRALKLEPKP